MTVHVYTRRHELLNNSLLYFLSKQEKKRIRARVNPNEFAVKHQYPAYVCVRWIMHVVFILCKDGVQFVKERIVLAAKVKGAEARWWLYKAAAYGV